MYIFGEMFDKHCVKHCFTITGNTEGETFAMSLIINNSIGENCNINFRLVGHATGF